MSRRVCTWQIEEPFPEEANRVLAWAVGPATLRAHCACFAQLLLRREGVAAESIFLTGNTVIDAASIWRRKGRSHVPFVCASPNASCSW